jgi:integrase
MRKQLKVVGASPHGFRSSFSDWAIEQGYSERLVDLCLAHKLKDAVEAAYNRTNRVTERIPLMQAWSEHVHGTSRT